MRWVVTRDEADLDALVLHNCEDCDATCEWPVTAEPRSSRH